MTDSVTFGSQFLTFIHQVHEVIDETIYPSKKYVDEPERFYYTILHKLATVGDVIAFLITNLDGKPHYANGTIILARTSMLDTICLYYVLDQTNDEENQKKRIDNILNDHVRSIYQSAANEEKKLEIRNQYPWCFESGKFRADIEKITTKKMIDSLHVEELKKPTDRALKLYSLFSKVEHNGLFTFNILHSHYNDSDKRSVMMNYDAALVIGEVIMIVLLHWVDKDDERYRNLLHLYGLMGKCFNN